MLFVHQALVIRRMVATGDAEVNNRPAIAITMRTCNACREMLEPPRWQCLAEACVTPQSFTKL